MKHLLENMLDVPWVGSHDHKGPCRHCQMIAMWFQLAHSLMDRIFPKQRSLLSSNEIARSFANVTRSESVKLRHRSSSRSSGNVDFDVYSISSGKVDLDFSSRSNGSITQCGVQNNQVRAQFCDLLLQTFRVLFGFCGFSGLYLFYLSSELRTLEYITRFQYHSSNTSSTFILTLSSRDEIFSNTQTRSVNTCFSEMDGHIWS